MDIWEIYTHVCEHTCVYIYIYASILQLHIISLFRQGQSIRVQKDTFKYYYTR